MKSANYWCRQIWDISAITLMNSPLSPCRRSNLMQPGRRVKNYRDRHGKLIRLLNWTLSFWWIVRRVSNRHEAYVLSYACTLCHRTLYAFDGLLPPLRPTLNAVLIAYSSRLFLEPHSKIAWLQKVALMRFYRATLTKILKDFWYSTHWGKWWKK